MSDNKISVNNCISCGSTDLTEITKEVLHEEQFWIEISVYDCSNCEKVFGVVTDKGVYFDVLQQATEGSDDLDDKGKQS